MELDACQGNSRIGVTLSIPVNRNNSLKFYASSSIETKIGSDIDLAGFAWQYRWDGGM